MSESAIQTQIRKKAEKAGYMVVKLIQTSTNGIPDQLLLRAGVARFIEVKQPGKQPTELQKHRHRQLAEQGFLVEVIDNVNDFDPEMKPKSIFKIGYKK